MVNEKSLWFYGKVYSKLFDPAHAEARQIIADMIENDASVLDVGCGTGTLSISA